MLKNTWTTLEQKKNWKEIVLSFDNITEIIIQPNKKSLRIRGRLSDGYADMYVDYNNPEVASSVYEKVKSIID